jgi:hypothetical protein
MYKLRVFPICHGHFSKNRALSNTDTNNLSTLLLYLYLYTMSSTRESPQNIYLITEEGDDFVPMNAIWTCNSGPSLDSYDKCGQRNEDITNKICSKCGRERGYGTTADLGQKTSSSGERGRFWMLDHNDDGSELWTYNFIDP